MRRGEVRRRRIAEGEKHGRKKAWGRGEIRIGGQEDGETYWECLQEEGKRKSRVYYNMGTMFSTTLEILENVLEDEEKYRNENVRYGES
jgi:hypothetical protein